MLPEPLAEPADAASDELIALVAEYPIQFYYHALEFQALECRLRQVTGGLTEANRTLLTRMAAELVGQHGALFESLEWPLPLQCLVNLHRRLDATVDPDYEPSGPPLAARDTPSF
jgi:hypothetical protein